MFDEIKIVGFFKENAIFIKTLIGEKMVLAVSSDSNVTLSGLPFVNIIIILLLKIINRKYPKCLY